MSNVFTLDALREETIRRYEPVELRLNDGTSVSLKALLRISKTDREAVVSAIEDVQAVDDDFDEDDDAQVEEYSKLVCDAIEKVFKLIASKPKRLLSELDHEDPRVKVSLYTAVLSRWMGETQVGEAEPSPA